MSNKWNKQWNRSSLKIFKLIVNTIVVKSFWEQWKLKQNSVCTLAVVCTIIIIKNKKSAIFSRHMVQSLQI